MEEIKWREVRMEKGDGMLDSRSGGKKRWKQMSDQEKKRGKPRGGRDHEWEV